MLNYMVVNNLENYFEGRADVSLAVLYGSFASGKSNRFSDIDIAVHTLEPASFEQLLDIQNDISKLFRRSIDLLDLRKAEGLILYEAITKGVKLKVSGNLFSYYNLKAIYFHEDFLPNLRFIQDAHIRRFTSES